MSNRETDSAKDSTRVPRWKRVLCAIFGHTHTEDAPDNAPPPKTDIWCCERCYTAYREES